MPTQFQTPLTLQGNDVWQPRMTNRNLPWRRWSDEAGVTSTELAVLMPVLIVLVLLPMQYALWWHAKQAADTAAEECVDAAQALDADVASDGIRGARAILNQAGNLTNVRITPTATADTVICTITGDLNYTIIGAGLSVSSQAEGSIERFVAESDR